MDIERERLIKILDDFIQYKESFERPPQNILENDYGDCWTEETHALFDILYDNDIDDVHYPERLRNMQEKYGTNKAVEFSKEELTYKEVFAVLTSIHRSERMGWGTVCVAIKNLTFYNLICRMEEIRNELILQY